MLANMLVGVTANVNAMVRSPSLVDSEDRSARAAETTVLSFRFTLVLVGPVLAMTLLVGEPVIEWALGAGFGAEGAHRIVVTLACLIGWILGSAGAIFAVVELLARGELRGWRRWSSRSRCVTRRARGRGDRRARRGRGVAHAHGAPR